jgi:hypothetical protein
MTRVSAGGRIGLSESMRNDVECTFGILKGKWRIRMAGIRGHMAEPVPTLFLRLTVPCTTNWLLEVDGLDGEWDQGKSSIRQGGVGEFEVDDEATQHVFALRRLRTGSSFRNYDLSVRYGSRGQRCRGC